MYGGQLGRQLDTWRASAEIDPGSVEEAIDDGLSGRIEQIRMTAADYPADAFAEFVTLTSFLNAAAGGVRPSIIEKIAKHIDELRNALGAISRGLKADSFSISASLPFGLSVSLSFPATPGE